MIPAARPKHRTKGQSQPPGGFEAIGPILSRVVDRAFTVESVCQHCGRTFQYEAGARGPIRTTCSSCRDPWIRRRSAA